MADSALLAAGGNDAPLSYTVPGATAIQIKQVHVAYVDNGAAAAWLPMVRITSDSGHTMGQAVDQGVKVTAGSDASVSFFPGVKHAAAAATGTNLSWGLAEVDALSLGSGAGFTIVDFSTSGASRSFGSSGDGVVTLGDVGGGTIGMILNTAGVYLTSWHVSASNNGVPAANSTIQLQCDFDTSDPTAGSNYGSAFVVSAGPNKQYDAGYQIVMNLAPANYPIPNTGRLLVRQNTGLTLSCYIRMFAVLLSTVTDPAAL